MLDRDTAPRKRPSTRLSGINSIKSREKKNDSGNAQNSGVHNLSFFQNIQELEKSESCPLLSCYC